MVFIAAVAIPPLSVLSAQSPVRRCRPGCRFPPGVWKGGVWQPRRASADLSIFPARSRLALFRNREPSSSSPAHGRRPGALPSTGIFVFSASPPHRNGLRLYPKNIMVVSLRPPSLRSAQAPGRSNPPFCRPGDCFGGLRHCSARLAVTHLQRISIR